MFEIEMQEFERRRQEWATAHRGEHVVLDGANVIGFFSSLGDAVRAGVHALRRADFFVSPPLSAEARTVYVAGFVGRI